MARAGIREIVFGLAAVGLLAGCVDSGNSAGAGGGTGFLAAPAKKPGAAQDVEAPEVFQATDSALWDGRPSLGGIWVAAPEVNNPERAILFNPATGKSVTGALFKRERENPGPRLQLSSDAAEALGILAGQPTEIRVTALRKAEVAEPAPDEEGATPASAADGTDAPSASDADAAAIATAALDAVDAQQAKSDAAGADPAAVAAGTVVAAAAVADGAAAVVEEQPKRKTWRERRAEAKAAREAKKRAAAEAAAAASAAEAEAALSEGEAPTATAESAAVAAVESAPLDARNPGVVAGTAESPKRRTVGADPAPATVEAPAPNETAPAVAGGPVRPIQVASFSKEDNAKRAAEALAKIGVTATPQRSEKNGTVVWGVVVRGDAATLQKIKDAGFSDAYFLN